MHGSYHKTTQQWTYAKKEEEYDMEKEGKTYLTNLLSVFFGFLSIIAHHM